MLASLRDQHEPVINAPTFDRSSETVVESAIPVRRETPLVITEGNYLLLQDPTWNRISTLLDQVWYLEVDDAVRMERLVARHMANGKSEADARAWATGTDERNALLIAKTRHRADLVVASGRLGDDQALRPGERDVREEAPARLGEPSA